MCLEAEVDQRVDQTEDTLLGNPSKKKCGKFLTFFSLKGSLRKCLERYECNFPFNLMSSYSQQQHGHGLLEQCRHF